MWRSPWQRLINRSEKIVGYPSSFINIRYLISDELATVATHVRRLVGTKHPLLKTAKSLIGDSEGVAQIRGLIVLLVSKAFNQGAQGINSQQKSLSEIVETANAAISIHRGLINVNTNNNDASLTWKDDMEFGNKMATLCGDYLLAAVSQALSELRNTKIVDTISQGIGDSIESTFITRDIRDEVKYKEFVYLASGSLFSRCCKAAVMLRSSGHDINGEQNGQCEEIVENWAVTWSELYALCEDIDVIVRNISRGKVTSKILQSKHEKAHTLPTIDNSDLELCRTLLLNTNTKLLHAHTLLPHTDKHVSDILAEMPLLLYQDAVTNINACL